MLFVQHEFALEVLDCHVIDCSSQKGELAVRYRAGPVPVWKHSAAILPARYFRCEKSARRYGGCAADGCAVNRRGNPKPRRRR